jgi:hypothetical protein
MDIVMKDAGSGKEQAEDNLHGLYMKTQDEESEVRYAPVTILSMEEMARMPFDELPDITAKMVGIVIPKERENLE